jgi:hypothetical protein
MGQEETMRTNICLGLALGLALAAGRSASATDYWDLAADNDNGLGTDNELVHGSSQQHDLQNNGGLADQDWYRVISYARSSYEAIIDSTSGDINMGTGNNFDRLDIGGVTLQGAEFANVGAGGYSVALRWQNTTASSVTHFLRAQSPACGATCTASGQYHIRFYETTIGVPRFNNALGQITVLIVQNTTAWNRPIVGTVNFWDSAGALVGTSTFSLVAKATLVLNTSTVTGVAGVGGTITISHNGGYGNLAAKSVALEPATGFSFDTPGLYKPR